MSSKRLYAITGTAPLSLGSAVAEEIRDGDPNSVLLGIDRRPSATIPTRIFDLNPFSHPKGYKSFARELRGVLEAEFERHGVTRVDYLIQNAGVYWSGPLLDSSPEDRANLLGVNLLSRIELLFATLDVNGSPPSRSQLTYIDIGSFQGLMTRPLRSLYALSKGSSVQLIESLVQGGEVSRGLYVAPGPIDTPMLHKNHWVVKSNGPLDFIEGVLSDDPELYQRIFVNCSDDAFDSVRTSEELRDVYERYKHVRGETMSAPLGVLSTADCADATWNVIANEDRYPSGVCVIIKSEGGANVVFRRFDEIARAYHFGLR